MGLFGWSTLQPGAPGYGHGNGFCITGATGEVALRTPAAANSVAKENKTIPKRFIARLISLGCENVLPVCGLSRHPPMERSCRYS